MRSFCTSYFRWTTEDDITDAVSNAGVSDLQEVKFAENKINGQVTRFYLTRPRAHRVIDRAPASQVKDPGSNPG